MLTLLRYLRQIIWTLFSVVVIALIASLVYFDRIGLPKSAYTAVENVLEKHNFHAKIGRLYYHPLDGLIAENITVESPEHNQQLNAEIGKALITVDKTKALRGILRIEKLELHDTSFSIIADTDRPQRGTLDVNECSASITMRRGNTYLIDNLRGLLNGIRIELQTKLKPASNAKTANQSIATAERRLLMRIASSLKKWEFEESDRPYLSIDMLGDLSRPALIRSTIQFEAPRLQKATHQIRDFLLDFDVQGSFIDINEIAFADERGQARASGHFDIRKGKGQLELTSEADFQAACNAFFGESPLPLVKLSGDQFIDIQVDLAYNKDRSIRAKAFGNMKAETFSLGKLSLEQASTDFSWSEGKFFARNLKSSISQREVAGKMLVDGSKLRVDLVTALPLSSPLLLRQSKLLLKLANLGEISKEATDRHRLKAEIPLSILR